MKQKSTKTGSVESHATLLRIIITGGRHNITATAAENRDNSLSKRRELHLGGTVDAAVSLMPQQ